MIPAVRRHWNYLISGDENKDFRTYFRQKYLPHKQGLQGLTLGCGEGQKVLEWAKTGLFDHIDGYELSEDRLKKARQMALEAGADRCIKYIAGDVNEIELPENHYHVVFIEHALHHFSPLAPLLSKLNKCLVPEGYFVFDEYVGPSRFQWTDQQLRLANCIRSILPDKYKPHIIDGRTNKKVIRPSRLSMILKDPSEAVESGNILPLTHQLFEVAEIRGYHGAILHLLLEGIAQNFMSEEKAVSDCLHLLFEIEDYLTRTREVGDDFAVVIARKKH